MVHYCSRHRFTVPQSPLSCQLRAPPPALYDLCSFGLTAPPVRSHQRVSRLLHSLPPGLLIPNSPPWGTCSLIASGFFPQLLCYRFSAARRAPAIPRCSPALLHRTQERALHKGLGLGTPGFREQSEQQKAKCKAAEEGQLKNKHFWALSKQRFTSTAQCCERLLQLSPERRARIAFSLTKKEKKTPATHLAMPQQSPRAFIASPAHRSQLGVSSSFPRAGIWPLLQSAPSPKAALS